MHFHFNKKFCQLYIVISIMHRHKCRLSFEPTPYNSLSTNNTYGCSAYQQDKIHELEPLRSHLRLVTEERDRTIQARWAEGQAEIAALRSEKQQLQKDIEAMREREKAAQAVVHDTFKVAF